MDIENTKDYTNLYLIMIKENAFYTVGIKPETQLTETKIMYCISILHSSIFFAD